MSDIENSDQASELAGNNSDLFSDRLKIAMGGESTNAFAKKCGYRESTIRGYLSGSMPSLDKASHIAKAAGVHLQWLATGEGQQWVAHATGSGKTEDAGVMAQRLIEQRFVESPEALALEFAMIPGYNVEVAAGSGVFPNGEEATRKLAFRHKWLRYRGLKAENLVLVFAKGDSMEPTITDNNTLMIDTTQRELNDGQIYVIRTDGHLIVKRIQKLWNKGILLLSDNKEYKEQQVEPNEADDLEVIGRVVWIGKDV